MATFVSRQLIKSSINAAKSAASEVAAVRP